MTFVNPLRAKWASGSPTFSAWVSTGEPMIAEYLAACGYDEVLADLQHGAVEMGHLPGLFQAIEARGSCPAARVLTNDPALIGRVLDLGALSVVVPMIETAEEAARAVAACRYPPRGTRSMGPLRSMVTMSSVEPDDLSNVVCLVQVETARGLENVEAIAATAGLDGIFIGPSDLALSMGMPESAAARSRAEELAYSEAFRRILAACESQAIVAAIITGDGLGARARVEEGFWHVAATSDLALLATGGARELDHAAGRGAPAAE